jgi:hypothetical protein
MAGVVAGSMDMGFYIDRIELAISFFGHPAHYIRAVSAVMGWAA